MDRQRYKPLVVVWDFRDTDKYVSEIRALGVPVLSFDDRISRIGKVMAFRRMVSRLHPEVLHSCSFHTNWAAWWATLGSTTVPVGSLRNSFILTRQETGTILGRLCARWPEAQIYNSSAAEKGAEHCTTLFKPKNINVVRNALNLDMFSARPLPRTVTILAVGNLYARKRWDRLIKAIFILSMRGIRAQFRHVGDGPLRSELEELARRLQVDDLIQFLGLRNDIPSLIADSTFLVHTAEDEGCPNVVMEAMACGRAVVAMDAGDVPYLIENGKTGLIVQRGDETTFAECVSQLLSDHELCCRMGLAARAKAEREFGLERLVSETLEAYRSAGWKETAL